MHFDGIDWTELSKFYGLYSESDSDEIILKKTKDFLLENYFPNVNDDVANTVRSFIVSLHERFSDSGRYSTPVWKGLLEIENNQTLMKYAIILLEYMWY